MAYTEIKKRNNREYYYRVKSVRKNNKVSKERIYLGVNITKEQLSTKEGEADKKFIKEKINKSINKIKSKIIKIIKKSGVKKAGVFGSYAQGNQKVSSDIDILIEPTKEMGFFEIIRLEDELKEKLKKKIDLITYASIHKLLKDRILQEEVRII
ncbi:MAG: nucleotidyltransferase domain-containing protein [Nanoarchaeota archaeon]|nr:nucleotidyltransferase domain-containing protein [Nanoarchaeota archaeon]